MNRALRRRKMPFGNKIVTGTEAQTAQVRWTPVFVQVREGRGAEVDMIVMQLHDELARGSNGAIPYELISFCPKCGNEFQIRGDEHKIDVEYLDSPKLVMTIPTPEGEKKYWQRANVSVEGVRTCPHDADANGKTICGYRFILTDNVMSPA